MYGLTKLAWWYKEARSLDAQRRRDYERMLQLDATTSTDTSPMDAYQESLLQQRSGESDIIRPQTLNEQKKLQINSLENRIKAIQSSNPNLDLSPYLTRLQNLKNEPVSRFAGFTDRAVSKPILWPNIYHGTNMTGAENIMRVGADPNYGRRNKFGSGMYFTTDKGAAESYAQASQSVNLNITDGDKDLQKNRKLNNLLLMNENVEENKNRVIANETAILKNAPSGSYKDSANHYINHVINKNIAENKPVPGLNYNQGVLVRFRNPNELQGTDIQYPKANQVRKVDGNRLNLFNKQENLSLAEQKKDNAGTLRNHNYNYAGTSRHFHIHGNKPFSAELFTTEEASPNSAFSKYIKQFPATSTTKQNFDNMMKPHFNKPSFFRSMTNKLQGFTNKFKGFRPMKG